MMLRWVLGVVCALLVLIISAAFFLDAPRPGPSFIGATPSAESSAGSEVRQDFLALEKRAGSSTGGSAAAQDVQRGFADVLAVSMTGIPRKGPAEPYSPQEMQIFEELRKKMPGNHLIPRIQTAAEVAEEKQHAASMSLIFRRMEANQASPEEIKTYYASRQKFFDDSREIAKYLSGSGDSRVRDNAGRIQAAIDAMEREEREEMQRALSGRM